MNKRNNKMKRFKVLERLSKTKVVEYDSQLGVIRMVDKSRQNIGQPSVSPITLTEEMRKKIKNKKKCVDYSNENNY